jgi:hypothetical protein
VQESKDIALTLAVSSAGDAAADEEALLGLQGEIEAIPRVMLRRPQVLGPPSGSKSVGWGDILLAVSAAGALAPTLLIVIRDWLLRQPPSTTIKFKSGDFEFEWSGGGPQPNIDELLNAMVDRTSKRP